VGGLTSGATYSVRRNGAAWRTIQAGTTGSFQFIDSVGGSTVSYSVQ